MIQLDLFAPPPPTPPPARLPDRLAERLVALGIEHNEWSLNNNRTVGSWGIAKDEAYPWCLPSRAFHFPIEFRGGGGKGDGWISLRHPELHNHPFVIKVGELLGEPVPWREVDEFGRRLEASTEWFHAVDLMNDAHWRDLLDTEQFTDAACVLRAIGHALHSPSGYEGKQKTKGRLSVANARAVLDWLGCVEPEDRSEAELRKLSPSKIEERNGKGVVSSTRWPVNMHLECAEDEAWAMIHAIEDGWFARGRDGYVQWSKEGLKRMGLA